MVLTSSHASLRVLEQFGASSQTWSYSSRDGFQETGWESLPEGILEEMLYALSDDDKGHYWVQPLRDQKSISALIHSTAIGDRPFISSSGGIHLRGRTMRAKAEAGDLRKN